MLNSNSSSQVVMLQPQNHYNYSNCPPQSSSNPFIGNYQPQATQPPITLLTDPRLIYSNTAALRNHFLLLSGGFLVEMPQPTTHLPICLPEYSSQFSNNPLIVNHPSQQTQPLFNPNLFNFRSTYVVPQLHGKSCSCCNF